MILRYILMFTQEPLIFPNYYKSSFSIPLMKREREREREREKQLKRSMMQLAVLVQLRETVDELKIYYIFLIPTFPFLE